MLYDREYFDYPEIDLIGDFDRNEYESVSEDLVRETLVAEWLTEVTVEMERFGIKSL